MMLDADLDDLVERARRGDRDGTPELIQSCHVPVRALLSALVHDRDEADDLAQQTFVFAYEHLREYRIGTQFLAWLKAIARNLAMDHVKRRSQRQASQDRFLREEIARRTAELAGTEVLESRLENAVLSESPGGSSGGCGLTGLECTILMTLACALRADADLNPGP